MSAANRCPGHGRARWLRRFVALVVLAWAPLVLGGPASAHTELVTTTPGDGGEAATGTRQVLMGFSEELIVDLVRVSVTDAAGEDHPVEDVTADGGLVTVALAPLVEGAYVVEFDVVAIDGHAVSGSWGFSVSDEAPVPDQQLAEGGSGVPQATSRGPGDGPPASHMEGVPLPPWSMVAAAALAAILVLLYRSAGRRAGDSVTRLEP